MAILTKAQLEELNQSSFPDNSSEAITPAILRTYNTATIDTLVDSLDTGSFIQDLTSLNAFTASQEAKDSTLSAYTASNDTKWSNIASQSGSWGASTDISSLNAFTASQETKNSTLASYTGSVNTQLTNLSTSQSIDNQKWVNIGSQSGSWGASTNISSLNAFTASQETKNTTLGTYTGSIDTKFTTLASVTSSLITSASNAAASESLYNTKFSNIGSQSGSWVTESETGSFATTGSNTFTGNQTINADLFVSGTINAYKINTTIESSSVIFSSGSNILGDAANDTQTLNGSVNVVNELTASGLHYPTADNGALSYLQTDGAGNLSFQYVNSILENVRYGEDITIGDPLYVSGSNGTRPVVFRADAANTNKMPVIYIATSTATANTNTTALTLGDIQGVTTTGYPAGTEVFVAEGGGWSASRPSGSASIVQPLGIVTKEGSGGSGRGLVLNPGPAFLPNIQTGYAWVGNGGNQPTAVPTSSFAQTINTGSFATTGSNTFEGSQNINGAVTASSGILSNGSLSLVVPFASIGMSANTQGSGSAYTGINTFVDVTTDPTNVYSAFQLIDDSNQNTLIGVAVNSYSPQYSTATPQIFGGGNNPDGNNGGIAFPSNGEMDVWKKTNLKYGISVTGSTELQSFTSSLQQGYAFVGGANGRTTTVPTSSFGGGSTINTGSFATTGSNTFNGSQTITGSIYQRSGNTILNGDLTVSGAHLFMQGNGDNTIQVTNGNITTNQQLIAGTGVISYGSINAIGSGISIQSNIEGSGSAYAIGTAVVDNTTDPTNVYSAWQLPDNINGTNFAFAWNSYTPYYSTSTPVIIANENYNGADTAIGFPSNIIEMWKPTTFKAPTIMSSSLNITSTLTASLQQGYTWVGGAGNVSKLVATSSFGGGGAAFPYSGTASISGSLQVTGSMSGLVTELSVVSNTASVDFTKGNFFSITLPASATTHFVVSNSIKGQTVNIQINQPAGASTGSVAFAPSILFAGGNDYQATATGSAIDLLTMVAITGSSVLATSIKNFL